MAAESLADVIHKSMYNHSAETKIFEAIMYLIFAATFPIHGFDRSLPSQSRKMRDVAFETWEALSGSCETLGMKHSLSMLIDQ